MASARATASAALLGEVVLLDELLNDGWGPRPEAGHLHGFLTASPPYSRNGDDHERAPCLFGACDGAHRFGYGQLAHAVRAHADLIEDGGHVVGISTGYASEADAVHALHEYARHCGVELRRVGRHGDNTILPFECAASATRCSDLAAFEFTRRSDARARDDPAVGPVAHGDTTRTDVRRRHMMQERGLGPIPDVSGGPCPARASVFLADCKWHWEFFSIHTHEVCAAIANGIRGVELSERADLFFSQTGGRGLSSELHAALVSEGRVVSHSAVAMAITRAIARSAPSASVPCNLSLLRLAAEHSELLGAVHLGGSSAARVFREPRPDTDTSRGAVASRWHETSDGKSMVTESGAMFVVVLDERGARRLADAESWYWDSCFNSITGDRGSSLGALVTVDADTEFSVVGSLIALGDQSGPTLVAALQAMKHAIRRFGYEPKPKVFVQDNSYKEFAAFCFVFSSILWRSLCLVSTAPEISTPSVFMTCTHYHPLCTLLRHRSPLAVAPHRRVG